MGTDRLWLWPWPDEMVPDGLGGGLNGRRRQSAVIITFIIHNCHHCHHRPLENYLSNVISLEISLTWLWSQRSDWVCSAVVWPGRDKQISYQTTVQSWRRTRVWERFWIKGKCFCCTLAPQWAAISSKGAFWNFSTTCLLRSLSCSSIPTLSTRGRHKQHFHFKTVPSSQQLIPLDVGFFSATSLWV